jgi:hypothetical protein
MHLLEHIQRQVTCIALQWQLIHTQQQGRKMSVESLAVGQSMPAWSNVYNM